MGYDLEGARKAGVSDEDSLIALAEKHNYDLAGARQAGISDNEILSTLVAAKLPPEPVVEKESPEALGTLGGVTGGVIAAGDVIYSKGRPLFRIAEKAMGMDTGAPAVKPRTFLDPSTVAEQAIARRAAPMPDVTGSPESVKNWGVSQHKGEFLGGSEYGEADKIKKEALAFESKNPTQKVLPGSLLAVPQEEADRLAKQRAELAAQQDVAKQAEVQKVAQTRAERLNERGNLKGQANKFGMAKGAGNLGVKVGAPILGGYEAGSQGAQAYNRLTRPDLTAGDVAAGATNVVGASTGALSMLPGRYRIPAAIISQGAGAIANFLDKRNPRNEDVEEKAQGGLAGYAEGGGPKLPGKFGKFQKVAEKAAHEFGDKSPGRMTDFLQNHIKKFVVPTQSDRMGGVGGPSFSANSIALPDYKGMVWGSGNEGTAKGIAKLAKDERFGGPENQIFVPLLGHQNQHKSNQIVFDKLMKEFYENRDKLTPELIEKINSFMRSGGGIDKKTGQTNFPMFSDFDITNKDDVAFLGKSFDNRGVIAQHAFGGERLDGKKAQIFPYQQRLDELADPTVTGAPTFAVGPRAFKLTGEINPEARPDLNAAFPNLLLGEDFGVTYKATPNGVLFQDFQNNWRKNKGKTEPLKSGKLPEPGYYENTLGYKVNPNDAERLYPRQEVTEQLLDSMYSQGYAAGGGVKHFEGGGKTGALLSLIKPAVNRIDMHFKDVIKRTPQITEAARLLKEGKLSREEFDRIVNQFKPVTPYNFVPQPATEAEAMDALGKKGIGKFKLALPEGHPVDLRLDIPAYKDKGVWVNSIHNAGQKNVIPDTSYSNIAAARDVGFEITPRNQERFLNYAADLEGQNKFTGARMQGLWTPMDDKDFIEKSQDALRSKDWTQIGMDPERHGYFYDRASMDPIAKADEVLQVGPLVLGKNPKYGKKKDSLYAKGGLVFNPEGEGYDYQTALAHGMGPNGTGENLGHWGSVAPTSDDERMLRDLPRDAYVMLKGKAHETFNKAKAAEKERGSKIVKSGDRYYSIPK